MRILFASLIPSYWGGSEILWSRAASALVREGHEVSAFFSMFREAPALDRLQAEGVRFHYGTTPPLRWWRRWLHRPRPMPELFAATLRAFRPELVVFSQCAVVNGLPQILHCLDQGVPYAIINQLVEPLADDPVTQRAISRAYRGAHRVWFVSPENLATVTSYLGHSLANAQSVPNAYDCAYDAELPWPAEAGPLRLALVARLEPEQKGHDLLLAALASPDWRERPVQVSFFGHGPGEQFLRAECVRLGLGQVVFAGQARDPAEIWRTNHALVLPSRYEGQSLAMLEAMLHGRPVIANPVGGTGGMVIEGETGFLAERADGPAFAAALERAWTHRTDWRSLGAAAARRVRRHVAPDPGAAMAALIIATLQPKTPALT